MSDKFDFLFREPTPRTNLQKFLDGVKLGLCIGTFVALCWGVVEMLIKAGAFLWT